MQVNLEGNQLPSDIFLGFKNSQNGEVIKGMYICNEDGHYLMSRIGLIAGQFYVREGQWYRSSYAIPQSMTQDYNIYINGEVIKVPKLTYWRSLTKQTGNIITAFLQKVDSVIVPQDKYTPLFSADVLALESISKSLVRDEATVLNPEGMRSIESELNALNAFLWRFQHVYEVTWDGVWRGDDPRDVFSTTFDRNQVMFGFTSYKDIVDALFQFHGSTATKPYSRDFIIEVLKKLSPTQEQIDKLNSNNIKQFYNTFLQLIQQKLSDPLFKDYSLVKGKSFSGTDIIELFRQNYGFTNEDPDLYFGVYGNQRNIPIDIAWLFDLNP